MNIEDYKNKKSVIDHDYRKRLSALAKDFAFSNSSVAVGDIVTDHTGSIKVEAVRFHAGNNPSCVYVGVELTKKLVPKKSGVKRSVSQIYLTRSE